MPPKKKRGGVRLLRDHELHKEVIHHPPVEKLLTRKIALERAEFASTFRGPTRVEARYKKTTLVRVCADIIGTHPEIILRQAETWDLLPNHLKVSVRSEARRHHASELQPLLIDKLFIEHDMQSLDLDHLSRVTGKFLRSLHSRLDRSILTSLSLVENEAIGVSPLASFLKGCNNLERLNLKRCYNITNDVFKDVAKSLANLTYLNVSFTRVTGSAIALIYASAPKLAIVKMAGCALCDGRRVRYVFPHPSDNLLSLKLRHVTLNAQDIHHILVSFPKLQNFDCSAAPSSSSINLATFIKMPHRSELRKLNLSNLPNLRLNSVNLLHDFFKVHDKLEHIYLTGIRVNFATAIPRSSLARLKTLFLPELGCFSPDFLPTCLEFATNLTYLDLSKTLIPFTFFSNDDMKPLVCNVPHLQILSLENASINDLSTMTIARIPTLRSLFLRNTLISTFGARTIVFACPWLEELDVSSCRNIPLRERRTLLQTLRLEFWERLEQAHETGLAIDDKGSIEFVVEKLYSEGEEREGLIYQWDDG